jgi:parallel beta-helix repeat protein
MLYNNTIYDNEVGIHLFAGTSNAAVVNNIVYSNRLSIVNDGSSTTLSHNLTTDPGFVDAASHDFGLSSGSAAIDAGVVVDGVRVDYLGVPRPAGQSYDIGAYERAASPASPAAPSNVRLSQ